MGYERRFCISVTVAFCSVIVTDMVHKQKPQAMDVYQGKTTLEYKVVDGVKIDSCVVWKDK